MALLDVRKKFIELSGRFDLVVDTTDYKDNGADWFINSGQKFLDRILDTGKTNARAVVTLKASKYHIPLQHCRAIFGVNLYETDGSSPVTQELNLDLMLKDYTTAQGTKPSEYCPSINNLAPDTYFRNLQAILKGAGDVDACHVKGVLFNVPADKDYVADVFGLFYSAPLVEDKSESYWTQVHDDILVMSALYKLEVFYRNKSGSQDWLTNLMLDVSALDMDEVAEQIATISQIGD